MGAPPGGVHPNIPLGISCFFKSIYSSMLLQPYVSPPAGFMQPCASVAFAFCRDLALYCGLIRAKFLVPHGARWREDVSSRPHRS